MPALMIQGVSSDAGKSLVVTALCRWLRRQGVSVAPFKAQNMSNNARVVDGGEIGTAQWLQALAAGVTPEVRMNPILLKPESDTRSQVVLNGVVDHELTAAPWRGRSSRLWPFVATAYNSLAEDFDVVLIEGAGSPAETNLWADDIVNMRVAEIADSPVALVADIDRGGAFAHLYGTWALLPPQWQSRIEGFVLNKFRGDPTLLAPAPEDLESATGVPTIGVLPWLNHALPDEEGTSAIVRSASGPPVSILCGPYASNLDEFALLQQVADVRWVRTPDDLVDAHLVVLPGSKNVAGDLRWLRETALDVAVRHAANAGAAVLGICGGLQMLGRRLDDPGGIDGSGASRVDASGASRVDGSGASGEGSSQGLGILPVATRYEPAKQTTHTSVEFGQLPAPWEWLSNRHVAGYEIRHGITWPEGDVAVTDGRLFFGNGNIFGVYLHGLFEDPAVLQAFSGAQPHSTLDATFDQLADMVEEHLDPDWLRKRLT